MYVDFTVNRQCYFSVTLEVLLKATDLTGSFGVIANLKTKACYLMCMRIVWCIQCFDLESYLMFNLEHYHWLCPVCRLVKFPVAAANVIYILSYILTLQLYVCHTYRCGYFTDVLL